MKLEGKVALITGGGTGLGRAISLALAGQGSHLAINYSRSKADAESVAAEARSRGVRAITVQADVSQSAQVKEMVSATIRELGQIDVLVNNAATTRYAPLRDIQAVKEEDWDRIMAVNVKGSFLCSQAVADHMRERGSGKIMMTTSNSGLMPMGSSIAYITSKAALVMLTRCLATALGPQVQVNSVAPGWMETRWMNTFIPEEVRAGLAEHAKVPPVGVDDVTQAVVSLLLNDSITGQTLVVDNGDVMH